MSSDPEPVKRDPLVGRPLKPVNDLADKAYQRMAVRTRSAANGAVGRCPACEILVFPHPEDALETPKDSASGGDTAPSQPDAKPDPVPAVPEASPANAHGDLIQVVPRVPCPLIDCPIAEVRIARAIAKGFNPEDYPPESSPEHEGEPESPAQPTMHEAAEDEVAYDPSPQSLSGQGSDNDLEDRPELGSHGRPHDESDDR